VEELRHDGCLKHMQVNNAAIRGTTIDSDASAASKITGTEVSTFLRIYLS
jgi:hypothetical protein